MRNWQPKFILFAVILFSKGFSLASQPSLDRTFDRTECIKLLTALRTNLPFQMHHFNEGSEPIVVGEIQKKQHFSKNNNVNVQDMPIKLPNTDVRVPAPYLQFKEMIEIAFAHERKINPNIDQYYAYLTVKQRKVGGRSAQRRPGLHADGFPESLNEEQVPIAHTYVVSDNNPTVFYPQGFSVNNKVGAPNVLTQFENQKNETARVIGSPYKVVYMDPYTVHRSPEFNDIQNIDRTFVRIIFSMRQHNRRGNGHNSLFNYSWPMYSRGSERASLYTLSGTDGAGNAVYPIQGGSADPIIDRLKMNSTVDNRLLVYSGSFDPPHIGHMYTLVETIERFNFHEVVVSTGYPYKNGSSEIEKLKLLTAAAIENLDFVLTRLGVPFSDFNILGRGRVEWVNSKGQLIRVNSVDDELNAGPGRALATLRQILGRYQKEPQDAFYLTGADSLSSIKNREHESLIGWMSVANWIVVNRMQAGVSIINMNRTDPLQNVLPNELNPILNGYTQTNEAHYYSNIYNTGIVLYSPQAGQEISSTELRGWISAGQMEKLRFWLQPRVLHALGINP